MRILQILYYYEPYTSGLTIYASRLARELTARGHEVSILASRHDSHLAADETTPEGVHIRRLPVATTLDRAVIVPMLIPTALRMMRSADVVHLHLPLVEAAPLVVIARLLRKRVVVTHHADLVLDGSHLARIAATVDRWSAIAGGKMADAFVTNTADRARVSPVAKHMSRNLRVIPPPIIVAPSSTDAALAFRQRYECGCGPLIGFAGRYAHEKGLDILLQTIPGVQKRFPAATYLIAGPQRDARTGRELRGPWTPWLERYATSILQLDTLGPGELAAFYAACDVLVLPSVNWTETFGMVQIEAMLCGTPVVASDLPGVREPVLTTGAGRLARAGDVEDLGNAIIDVLDHPGDYAPVSATVEAQYGLAYTIEAYERIYAGQEPSR